MKTRMTAGVGWLEGGGIEQKGKRTHGYGQQCGDCCGEAAIGRITGNGKTMIKKSEKKG